MLWFIFSLVVIAMMAVDLFWLGRKEGTLSFKLALTWVLVCIGVALAFNVFIYYAYNEHWFGLGYDKSGAVAATEYFTAWLLEQSLGIDNVFVFALVFGFFRVPEQYQKRVLFWGVLGAIVLRGVMIAGGVVLINNFQWTLYVFALLLLYAAYKMIKLEGETFNPEHNLLFRLARKLFPVSPAYDGERFLTRLPDGRRALTPLALVLIVIESTDVLFAVDSIPAVFGITRDPFLVFSSNIFAILNLRSLYFVLSSVLLKFERLKTALIGVLVFIAIKMLIHDLYIIPTYLSLLVVAGLIIFGVIWSIVDAKKLAKNELKGE